MKKFLFIIFLLHSISILAAPPLEIQLGAIEFKGERDTVATLYAKGKPLVISALKSTCSCTKVRWEKRPTPPGDSTQISINFRGLDRGMFYKVITLETNDYNQPSKIILRGEVK